MKVLIPSDNRDFVAEMAAAYQEAGCEVVTGTFNFDLRAAAFDLVHFQWPEEFSAWEPPSEQRLNEIAERVEWWAGRSATIITAHNFYPHGYDGNQTYKKLYEAFYANCGSILHFSTASKNLIYREFAGARHDRHFVTNPWNFNRTLERQRKRGSCREEFRLSKEHFVVLVLGALRSSTEVDLIATAFSKCRVPGKKLMMAGRYNERGSRLGQKLRRMRWQFWLWRQGASIHDGFIPDEDLSRYLDSADIVLIPRVEGLNSGVLSLAMTFGRMVVAPNHGPFPESLADTGNILYESGNPSSLAEALEKAARSDRQQVGAANRRRADKWRWENIVNACLQATEKTAHMTATK